MSDDSRVCCHMTLPVLGHNELNDEINDSWVTVTWRSWKSSFTTRLVSSVLTSITWSNHQYHRYMYMVSSLAAVSPVHQHWGYCSLTVICILWHCCCCYWALMTQILVTEPLLWGLQGPGRYPLWGQCRPHTFVIFKAWWITQLLLASTILHSSAPITYNSDKKNLVFNSTCPIGCFACPGP